MGTMYMLWALRHQTWDLWIEELGNQPQNRPMTSLPLQKSTLFRGQVGQKGLGSFLWACPPPYSSEGVFLCSLTLSRGQPLFCP